MEGREKTGLIHSTSTSLKLGLLSFLTPPPHKAKGEGETEGERDEEWTERVVLSRV